MYTHLYKQLILQFTAESQIRGLVLELLPKKDQPRVNQVKLYSLSLPEKARAYLMLEARENDNRFTMELGLSRRGGFPYRHEEQFDWTTNRVVPQCPIRCRLGNPFPPFNDFWWPTTSTEMPRRPTTADYRRFFALLPAEADFPADLLAASVVHAMDCLVKFGIPFLKECANSSVT